MRHTRGRFRDTLQIKQANVALGQHFFDRDTLSFFRSRVHDAVYGGRFFVTSESGPSGERRYTVRVVDNAGRVDTVGDFQAHTTSKAAHAAAADLGRDVLDAVNLAVIREWVEVDGERELPWCLVLDAHTDRQVVVSHHGNDRAAAWDARDAWLHTNL